MGIVHFAPLGTNPGAVTSALAYLQHNQDRPPFAGTFKGQIIESVVLFASPDVRRGQTPANECIWNDYMSTNIQQRWRERDRANAIDIALNFIKREIAPGMPSKGSVYCYVVDPHNFDDCFEAVAKAALTLGDPQGVGKNIWANLTGGTNVVNAALLEVAFLSGLISRIYYTFVADESGRKYLQPITGDEARFRWDEIGLVKTAFDEAHYAVLRQLSDKSDWCEDEELLGRLKAVDWEHFPAAMDISTFRQQLLNKMNGNELEGDAPEGHRVRLSERGKQILQRINGPLFQALVARGQEVQVDVEALMCELDEKRFWTK